MRKILGIYLCLLVWQLSGSSAGAAETHDCKAIGVTAASLQQKWSLMPIVFQIPDDGVIEGLRMASLYRKDHSRFVPSTVRAAKCVIELSFDPPVLDSLVAGAKQAVAESQGADLDDRSELVQEEINKRLEALFSAQGLPKGSGLTKLLIHLEDQFGFDLNSWDVSSSLKTEIHRQGLYSTQHMTWYLVTEFLNDKGVDPEFSRSLIAYMREKDRSSAPPSSLQAAGCKSGIQYRWPTVSLPFVTFKEVASDENVHWGICRASGDVWVYHYSAGWQKASPEELPGACEAFGDQRSFRRSCSITTSAR